MVPGQGVDFVEVQGSADVMRGLGVAAVVTLGVQGGESGEGQPREPAQLGTGDQGAAAMGDPVGWLGRGAVCVRPREQGVLVEVELTADDEDGRGVAVGGAPAVPGLRGGAADAKLLDEALAGDDGPSVVGALRFWGRKRRVGTGVDAGVAATGRPRPVARGPPPPAIDLGRQRSQHHPQRGASPLVGVVAVEAGGDGPRPAADEDHGSGLFRVLRGLVDPQPTQPRPLPGPARRGARMIDLPFRSTLATANGARWSAMLDDRQTATPTLTSSGAARSPPWIM